jgi:hypothetical protein
MRSVCLRPPMAIPAEIYQHRPAREVLGELQVRPTKWLSGARVPGVDDTPLLDLPQTEL